MWNCYIIDGDSIAADELAGLLRGQRAVGAVVCRAGVPLAGDPLWSEPVELLFIRISLWDDYQKVAPFLVVRPRFVVFLSGRMEKCTQWLSVELDFHLHPPYTWRALMTCFRKMEDPAFTPRPLDFFFLRVECRYHCIAYSALRSVHSRGHFLTVHTSTEHYLITGSLAQFERRLPMQFTRLGRSLLVAGPF